MKKKSQGESQKPSKRGGFIWKTAPEELRQYVREHPDATLKELKEDLGFSISTIWYRLKQLKIRLKKKSLGNEEHKEEFRERIAQIDPSTIVYVDQSGLDSKLYRTYGRAMKKDVCKNSREKNTESQYHWRLDQEELHCPFELQG